MNAGNPSCGNVDCEFIHATIGEVEQPAEPLPALGRHEQPVADTLVVRSVVAEPDLRFYGPPRVQGRGPCAGYEDPHEAGDPAIEGVMHHAILEARGDQSPFSWDE